MDPKGKASTVSSGHSAVNWHAPCFHEHDPSWGVSLWKLSPFRSNEREGFFLLRGCRCGKSAIAHNRADGALRPAAGSAMREKPAAGTALGLSGEARHGRLIMRKKQLARRSPAEVPRAPNQ